METTYAKHENFYLKEELWETSLYPRSALMTPLYVERYCGGRHDKAMSEHVHWEFSVYLSGNGVLEAERPFPIASDMVLLVPPGVSHRECAKGDLDSIWLGFEADLPGVSRRETLWLRSMEFARKAIRYWLFAARNHGAIGPELDGQLFSLVNYFFRERELCPNGRENTLQDAVRYFNEHYQENISMSDLAEQMNCSEGHFYRQFKEFTGQTPIHFLNEIRLKKAAFYLLNSNLPINRIAGLCGFNDAYYFSRCFKKAYGSSPLFFRLEK